MEKIANFINGKSVPSTSGETTKIVDPSTGQAYAEAAKSNSADVDAAMKAAATAFEEWKDTTPSERQRALRRSCIFPFFKSISCGFHGRINVSAI